MENKEYYEKVIANIISLLERSENRIDKTNDMICKTVSMVDKLTSEYTKQISKLQEVRDEMIKENKILLKLVEDTKKEAEYANRRYDTLIDKLFMMQQGKSENNINVS